MRDESPLSLPAKYLVMTEQTAETNFKRVQLPQGHVPMVEVDHEDKHSVSFSVQKGSQNKEDWKLQSRYEPE